MEQLIEQLLANLDSLTLERLPCFYDRPDQFQFRIGLEKGPQIRFQQETEDLYYLAFKDENGNYYQHPIHKGSDKFFSCQNISSNIRTLQRDPQYSEMIRVKIDILLKNLVNLVEPIIIESKKQQ